MELELWARLGAGVVLFPLAADRLLDDATSRRWGRVGGVGVGAASAFLLPPATGFGWLLALAAVVALARGSAAARVVALACAAAASLLSPSAAAVALGLAAMAPGRASLAVALVAASAVLYVRHDPFVALLPGAAALAGIALAHVPALSTRWDRHRTASVGLAGAAAALAFLAATGASHALAPALGLGGLAALSGGAVALTLVGLAIILSVQGGARHLTLLALAFTVPLVLMDGRGGLMAAAAAIPVWVGAGFARAQILATRALRERTGPERGRPTRD